MARKKKNDISTTHHPNWVAEGGNAKGIYIVQEISSWGKPDLQDPKSVTDRLVKFFSFMAETDSRPLVSGMAQALGVSRQRLYEIVYRVDGTDGMRKVNQETQEIIADAYQGLETAFEYNFMHGKINPVTGIWMSRNHFGYQDKREISITHKNPLGDPIDKEALESRLLQSIVTTK